MDEKDALLYSIIFGVLTAWAMAGLLLRNTTKEGFWYSLALVIIVITAIAVKYNYTS